MTSATRLSAAAGASGCEQGRKTEETGGEMPELEMLEHGASVNSKDVTGLSPCLYAAPHGWQLKGRPHEPRGNHNRASWVQFTAERTPVEGRNLS
jgi:hypothetical protein